VTRELALVLSIDETVYRIEPVEAVGRVYRLEKVMNAGVQHYNVVLTPFGPTCDCGDYEFRREGLDAKGCKHIQALAHYGML
jgi:hypothetical protein